MKNRDQIDDERNKNLSSENSVKNAVPIPGLHDVLTIKEERSQNASRNSGLFLSIGFCLSMLLVITAFEHKFYDSGNAVKLGSADATFEKTIEIPPTEQVPPPPPKISQPAIISVANDEDVAKDVKVDLDINVNEDTKVAPAPVIVQQAPVEEEEAQLVFTIVEDQPAPIGGMDAFYKYVADNLKYPSMARRNNIEGRVFIRFVVEKDGSLSDVSVLKGIGGGCDEEAVRVVKEAPKWKPGKQRGRPVRVQMILPIVFKLEI